MDILRSFAESRSSDLEVVRGGITYATARAAVADFARLTRERDEARAEAERLRRLSASRELDYTLEATGIASVSGEDVEEIKRQLSE